MTKDKGVELVLNKEKKVPCNKVFKINECWPVSQASETSSVPPANTALSYMVKAGPQDRAF